MKNKKIIYSLVIFILIIGVYLGYTYKISDPIFRINDSSFSILGGIKNEADIDKDIIGADIGDISKQVYSSPKNNGDGFKIVKESKIYLVEDAKKGNYDYSVIIKIEDKYYIASLYIENKDFTTKEIEKFKNNF